MKQYITASRLTDGLHITKVHTQFEMLAYLRQTNGKKQDILHHLEIITVYNLHKGIIASDAINRPDS